MVQRDFPIRIDEEFTNNEILNLYVEMLEGASDGCSMHREIFRIKLCKTCQIMDKVWPVYALKRVRKY